MPSNETEKTKSALKLPLKTLRLYGLGIVGAALILFLATALWTSSRSRQLQIGGKTYELTQAKTEAQQRKGLGGTQSLGVDQGMLFVYGQQKEQCFWMKDMHYAIDIIWVDAGRNIVAIESTVDPATYPKTFCHEGSYVIELNAGEAARNGLKQGQTLNF